MGSLWKRILGEEEEGSGDRPGLTGEDYVRVSELMLFNRNLVEALKHEQMGIALYTRYLQEAHDKEGREMYQKLIDEEIRHLRMVEEEIEEHKRKGYWS
ncbi:MAG: ferritin-like domain-containing protein [Deltaproteobacteria bacterium]|nr:ferritin-like domain-containing protein [Deltaproteobacteria bacterium]